MANEGTRTAIVKGSSRGVGAAVARRLAKGQLIGSRELHR